MGKGVNQEWLELCQSSRIQSSIRLEDLLVTLENVYLKAFVRAPENVCGEKVASYLLSMIYPSDTKEAKTLNWEVALRERSCIICGFVWWCVRYMLKRRHQTITFGLTVVQRIRIADFSCKWVSGRDRTLIRLDLSSRKSVWLDPSASQMSNYPSPPTRFLPNGIFANKSPWYMVLNEEQVQLLYSPWMKRNWSKVLREFFRWTGQDKIASVPCLKKLPIWWYHLLMSIFSLFLQLPSDLHFPSSPFHPTLCALLIASTPHDSSPEDANELTALLLKPFFLYSRFNSGIVITTM